MKNRHSRMPESTWITSFGQAWSSTPAGMTVPACTSKLTLVTGETWTLLKACVTLVRCSEERLIDPVLTDPVVCEAEPLVVEDPLAWPDWLAEVPLLLAPDCAALVPLWPLPDCAALVPLPELVPDCAALGRCWVIGPVLAPELPPPDMPLEPLLPPAPIAPEDPPEPALDPLMPAAPPEEPPEPPLVCATPPATLKAKAATAAVLKSPYRM
jgi:hypothetical protein